MLKLLQFLANGIMVGGVYSLIALGIVLIYKSTRVFNFAVGELLAIGSFVCYSALVSFKLPFWLSVTLTLASAILVGILVERLALRPLIGQPILAAIMATLALSLIMRGIMLFIWGASTVSYPRGIFPGGVISSRGIVLSHELLTAFLGSMAVFGILTFFFRRTKTGLFMRATAEGHQIAQSIGIKVRGIFAMTWGIGSIIAAMGGVVVGNRLGVGVDVTPLVALKAFPAVLFGGLESIPGALIGGLAIGLLENLAGGLINPKLAEITPYILLLLVLLVRPEGLFGLKRIERI